MTEAGAVGSTIPIVQEEAFVSKRLIDTEHVRVHLSTEEVPVVVRDAVARDHLEIKRVAVEREVGHVPPNREEGNVTIIPVLEERLVVEKRLFLVEEIHITHEKRTEAVELPTTLRRTNVDVERQDLTETSQEDVHGRTR